MHTRYCLDNEKLSYLCKVHEQLKFAFCMNNEKLSYLDTNNLQGITRGFILELCKCKFIGKVLTNLMDLLTRIGVGHTALAYGWRVQLVEYMVLLSQENQAMPSRHLQIGDNNDV